MSYWIEFIVATIFIGLSIAFCLKGFGKITDNADVFIKKKYGEDTSYKISAVLFVVIMALILISIIASIFA